MKRKILAILISLLFITMVPSVIGDICEPETEDEWIYLKGIFFHKLRKGNFDHWTPIHIVIWYKTSEGLTHKVYRFEQPEDIDVILDSAYLGRMYEVGLGLFTYICTFNRGLEILE